MCIACLRQAGAYRNFSLFLYPRRHLQRKPFYRNFERNTASSMARRRSRKCRLFGSRNLSGSASDSVAERSKGPAQVPTREVASISGTPGDVSQGGLERIRHFFHRSNQGSVASPARGVQEQGKQDQAAPAHDTQGPTDNSGTGTVPAAPGNNVDATVRPTGDTGKDTADPNSGANTTPTPAPVPVGGELDVAQQGLEHMQPIPHVGQTAAELVKKANTGVDNIQNFSDTYLQPLKIFSSVVTTVAQVGASFSCQEAVLM
ncbi:hypothetical protein EV401DRAFT_235076 [Pisolithus croceorrhizus]|nr:hypothetical protein EV401DRAFT_235076 [Pisolithus croceorrhizus]